MNKSRKTLAFKTTAIALAAATSLTLSAPAFAGGRHHGNGGNGWAWSGQQHHGGNAYHGGNRYRHNGHNDNDDNDDALAAVAIVGGVLLGAALLSSASQPSNYTQSPQTVYAPQPSYGYDQMPIQAVPSSDVYQAQSGQYCREYQSQANIAGRMQYGYGTACLQPDGSWRVVN